MADAERQVIAANAAAQALLAERPWVLEGGGLADALNALEPLGRTFPASWPVEDDSGHPIDVHLADGRAFQVQTVFRHAGPAQGGEGAGWIVRLADITP